MFFTERIFYGLPALAVMAASLPVSLPALPLALNEIMASNSATAADVDGDFPDWIELHNWGDEPIPLEGFGLSDDYDRPFRWVFPAVTLQPGGFLLVRASGKNRRDPGSELHANFSIAASGEEVLLTSPEGDRIDELSPRPIPTGQTVGRHPDGTGDWFYFKNPTPGAANTGTPYEGLLEAPVFSHQAGFYSNGFELELTAADGAVIVYTLDGSEPEAANLGGATYQVMNDYPNGPLLPRSFSSHSHEGPITVESRLGEANDISEITTAFNGFFRPGTEWEPPGGEVAKATVVRARAVKPGWVSSPVATHTYFVGEDASQRHTLPVVTIATTEKGLFDYEEGIYVPGKIFADWRRPRPGAAVNGSTPANYLRRGREWELPAHIGFFEPGGVPAFSQNAGIRIHGGWSRANRQKALRVYFRNEYDDESSLQYPLIPGHPKQGGHGELDEFKRFILHVSGQDNGLTMFRDAMAQSLISHTGIDTQAYRPVVVYLNGEYWGIHNIRERYDRYYVATNYDLDPDDVVILERNAAVVEGAPGDQLHFTQLRSHAETRAAQGTINQPGFLETMDAGMDIDNFIHHYAAQIYYANIDWPANNLRWWRHKGEPDPDRHGHDGRWRWMMYDTDHGFGLFVTDGWGGWNIDASHDTVAHALGKGSLIWSNPAWATSLFRSLVQNTDFRHRFVNAFADHLNTSFRPDRVIARINEMQAALAPDYPEHALRWNQPSAFWSGGDTWEEKIQVMRDFAQVRVSHVRTHLNSHFSLGGISPVTVDRLPAEGGKVRINTLTIEENGVGMRDTPYPWSGIYFRNVPVTLTALAEPGYQFKEWRDRHGAFLAETETLTTAIGTQLTAVAVFEAEPPPPCLPEPHPMADGPYRFSAWPAGAPAGTYPPHMVFQQTERRDPELTDSLESLWVLPYDLDSRSRIVGLDDHGVGFINTSNAQDHPAAGYAGAALLGLNTVGAGPMRVTWTGGTVLPNSRVYHLRLQYRAGAGGPFQDLTDEEGDPVEYRRNEAAGHAEEIGPVRLPVELENQPCVQLRWKYYFTGDRLDQDSGQRSFLRIGEILVESVPEPPAGFTAWQEAAFPDPNDLADPEKSGPLAQPWGDGIPNLTRYALDIPVEGPEPKPLPVPAIDAEGLSLVFVRDPDKTDIAYVVEATGDLHVWEEVLFDSRLDPMPNNEGIRMRIRDPEHFQSSSRRFLRLRIILTE